LEQVFRASTDLQKRLTCSELQNRGAPTIDALAQLPSFQKNSSGTALLVNATTSRRQAADALMPTIVDWSIQDGEKFWMPSVLQRVDKLNPGSMFSVLSGPDCLTKTISMRRLRPQ